MPSHDASDKKELGAASAAVEPQEESAEQGLPTAIVSL